MTPYEDAPFRPFHLRVVASGAGGQFSDGFSLGIIGIALGLAKGPLGLSNWWLGALGAASLIGLFFGSLIAGPISDRIG
jgi:putative MFS transporter